MAKSLERMQVIFPWWWRGYVWAARIAHMAGIPVDPHAVAEVIVRHAKFRAE